jgi:exo-beta-1,3-glucanase (GH17 family)
MLNCCSFATLLLNAGASVLTVQALLEHKHVDTTLRYARVYDSMVDVDYVQAMRKTEQRFGLVEGIAPVQRQHDEYRQDGYLAVASPHCTDSVSASLVGQLIFMRNDLPSRPI